MKKKVLIIFKYPRGNWNPAIISKFSNFYETDHLYLSDFKDKNFENGYIRTPLGGFYNHSNNPNVRRVVSDTLPKLKCGDLIDDSLDISKIPDGKANRENLYPEVVGKYMFLVSIKDIKVGQELTANYNLYTYPKTGIGLQTF